MRKTDKITKKAPLRSLFLYLTILLASQLSAQSKPLPFNKGETLVYELTYQWGLIWADAGMATFTVDDTLVGGHKCWHFRGYGQSYRHWDWFYEVRSTYESWADSSLNSLRFKRHGFEGSTIYDRDYHVKPDSIFYRISDDLPQSLYGKIPSQNGALDVVTAIYYCRTLDFSQRSTDEIIPLTFYLDGSYFNSHLRFKGIEQWKDPRSDRTIECIVFTPNLIKGTIFKEGEGMTVYVSNDERRIPVYIETELRIGKAKIFLING